MLDSTLSVKSLAIGVGVAGGIYTCYKLIGYSKYGQSGPYLAGRVSYLNIIQRCLTDCTKSSIKINWQPSDSLPRELSRRYANNGHALSGAVRDTARVVINTAVVAAGFIPYEISPSDRSNTGDRSHPHYAPGDLDQDYKEDIVSRDHAVICNDTDYYVEDWSDYLVGNPAIFHTFSPTEVAGKDGDCRFRIQDNKIIYEVSGGNCWSHYIWNWTTFGEFIEVAKSRRNQTWFEYFFTWIGIEHKIIYKIVFSRPWEECPHRAMVWLLPQYTYMRCRFLPCDMNVRPLKRVIFASCDRPGWNAIVSLRGVEPYISFGREGEDLAISIPKESHDAIMGLKTTQAVTTRCLNMGITNPIKLAMIGQYFDNRDGLSGPLERLANPFKPKVHWPLNSYADEDEVAARTYSNPLVSDENMMPMLKRWESISNSLQTRVFSVLNDATPPPSVLQYVREFLELVVPEPHVGDPYSVEEAATMLSKPSQVLMVSNIWETADVPPRQLIESFIKNEPCKKDARIISSFPDMRYLLHFSKFTLKCRDEVLHAEHNKHWFMPGRTPFQISDEVCNYVSNIDSPMEMDYENLDGSVSAWCQRNIMNAVYKRYFMREYHYELDGYLSSLVTCPSRSKRFGFRYDSGPGVKSGSPTTCDANTILNGFVQYMAVRKYYGPNLSKELAFQQLGLAFGDDSLFSDRFRKTVNISASQLGLKLKCEKYKPDEGITFLARVFPDPTVTTTSFQDPLRTLRKLHITTRNPTIPLAEAAYDRMTGYLVIDRITPLVSNYCRAIIRIYEPAVDHQRRLSRKSKDVEKPYWYTSENESWPQREGDIPLMVSCMSARTGIPEDVINSMSNDLDNAIDPWDLPTFNRDFDPFPWKGTVYPDGGTGESVDLRSLESSRKIVQQHGRDTHGGDIQIGPEVKRNTDGSDKRGDKHEGKVEETGGKRTGSGFQGPKQPENVLDEECIDDSTSRRRVPLKADGNPMATHPKRRTHRGRKKGPKRGGRT